MTAKHPCAQDESALKAYFLGPHSENAFHLEEAVLGILHDWMGWRRTQFPADGISISIDEIANEPYQRAQKNTLSEAKAISKLFHEEVPRHSPRYIGHMFSEFTIPSLLGHLIALVYNPNNISKEVSRVGLDLERQAVLALTRMVGYPDSALGHFTSGGTVANFEMIFRAQQLWICRLEQTLEWAEKKLKNKKAKTSPAPLFQPAEVWQHLHLKVPRERLRRRNESASPSSLLRRLEKLTGMDLPEPLLLVPESAHYSWKKGARLAGLGSQHLVGVAINAHGQMDAKDLKLKILAAIENQVPILGVVSVMGTTELGVLDRVDQIYQVLNQLLFRKDLQVWYHIDAAYGGFFATLRKANSGAAKIDVATRKSLEFLKLADSITIDPHKLGYVPYSSGCFLCRDAGLYRLTGAAAPYLDFKKDSDPGPFTLEGSRSAAGAIATLMSSRALGFDANGLGRVIARTLTQTQNLRRRLARSRHLQLLNVPGLNIVCFAARAPGRKLSSVNAKTLTILQRSHQATLDKPESAFFLSKTVLSRSQQAVIDQFCKDHRLIQDSDELVLIRCTLMNPFLVTRHAETSFISEIVRYFERLLSSRQK